jgi:hypothetical protein
LAGFCPPNPDSFANIVQGSCAQANGLLPGPVQPIDLTHRIASHVQVVPDGVRHDLLQHRFGQTGIRVPFPVYYQGP